MTDEEVNGISKIFGPLRGSRLNAHINYDEAMPGANGIMLGSNAPNPFSTYAEGYKKLADAGVKHLQESHGDTDLMIYPIIFSYRQYLELRFKELIRTASEFLDKNTPSTIGHDLKSLWLKAGPLLEEVWPEEDEQDWRDIGNVVDQFSEIDSGSDAFRYPVDRDGNRSLPGMTYINATQVKEAIDKIANVLDGASCTLEYKLEDKAEGLAEAYREQMRYWDPSDQYDWNEGE